VKDTDELYNSHDNKNDGGDHGLFTRHYDGNLRFMPIGAVVRALIYLQSDATYKVVFAESGVEKAFESYEFGLLDFHKELHWVEGDYDPDDRQRIILKCNYLKAAMEYSKSPKTRLPYAVGYGSNVMRLLNNVHPLAPLALIAALLVV